MVDSINHNKPRARRRRPPCEVAPIEPRVGSANQLITSLIALDPSLNESGYAVFYNGEEFSGVIRTDGKTVAEKLWSLRTQLQDLLDEHHPARAVVEYPPSFIYDRSKNEKTGKGLNQESLIKLSLATGVVIATCIEAGCLTDEVLATFWKGRITKKASQVFANKSNHNEADACLLRRWYLARNNPVVGPLRRRYRRSEEMMK